jgi:hypothetical protein
VVAGWVREHAADKLAHRASRLASIEATPIDTTAEGASGPVAPVSQRDIKRLSEAPTANEAPPLVTGGTTSPRRQRRGLVVGLTTFGLVVAVAVGGVFVAGRLRGGATASVPPPPAVAAPSATPSTPVASTAAAAAPLESAVASATTPTPPVSARSAPARSPVRPPHGTPARKDCDPPYVIDPSSLSPDGQPVKRFKPWCL